MHTRTCTCTHVCLHAHTVEHAWNILTFKADSVWHLCALWISVFYDCQSSCIFICWDNLQLFFSFFFLFSFFFFFYFCVWHFKTIFFTHSSTILVQLVSLVLLFQVTNHRWDVSWLCCIQTIEELTEYYNWLGSVADLIKNWKAWECIMQWSNMKNKYGLACHSLSHNVKISPCMHW